MTPPPPSSTPGEADVQDRDGAATAHPRKLRGTSTPRSPRRVSGPAQGRAADAPARRLGRESRRSTSRGVAARTAAFVKLLPDHPLLDRILRGRVWIPLLGVMLVGIVASQVEILKLGASAGRSVQLSTQMSMVNEQLQANVATLADDQRIERIAAGMGMVMPPPGAVGFLHVHGSGDAAKAIANIHAPDAASFMSLTSSNGAVVDPTGQSTTTAAGTVATSTGATTTAPTATAPTTTAPTATAPTATTPTGATSTTAATTGAASSASQSPGG